MGVPQHTILSPKKKQYKMRRQLDNVDPLLSY